MAKRLTQKEFKEKLENVNPNILILSEYINSHSSISCKCKICGHEWNTIPNKLLTKRSECPNCKHSLKELNYIKKIEEINPNIEIIGNYIKNDIPISCKCKKCGTIWNSLPKSLLYGVKCPKCERKPFRNFKTHEEFISEMSTINPDIEILRTYINGKTKIECLCKKCKHIWKARPDELLNNHGCPKCNQSKGEKIIEKYLLFNNINYINNYKINIDKSINPSGIAKIDFYLPDYNLFIEYNGIQHYIPIKYFGGEIKFERQQKRDNFIRNYCKENNINLLEIPYNKLEEEITYLLNSYVYE